CPLTLGGPPGPRQITLVTGLTRPRAPPRAPCGDQDPMTVAPGWAIHSVYCTGHVEVGGRVSKCASCWVDRLTISRGAAPYGVSAAALVASRTGRRPARWIPPMTALTSPGPALVMIPVGRPQVPRTTWANSRAATLSTITTEECDGSAPHNCSTAATSPAPVVRNASPDRARRVAGSAGSDSATPNVIAAAGTAMATTKHPVAAATAIVRAPRAWALPIIQAATQTARTIRPG